MKRVINWLDNNILAILAGFLLVFIPLYPKWPLFDVLYGYNVRVRLEDFFVATTIIIYIIWFLRRKFNLSKEVTVWGLIGYLVVGLLSSLVAIFVIQTVPLEKLQVGKTLLHWLRRAEYFSLFFVFFSTIRSMRRVRVYITLFFVTFLGVIIYGFGQKYLYWPAFSTMNREFSKGWWLYLTEHARVLSTFGGHYDLAGYLVIALTLGWSFFFAQKRLIAKFITFILIASGFWLLILTASRISFAAYIISLSVVVFLWMFKKGLGWGISRWLITIFLSMFIMLSFGDLSDRFLRVIKIDQRIEGLRSILLKPSGSAPQNNAVFLENNLAAVASKSDTPPSLGKPAEVTGSEEPLFVPTLTASGSTVLVQKTRTYSNNAILYDLSTGIRLDATWPRALKGFTTNPILGSGYATLTKVSKYEFTESESTDNDFLRALGETGLLGFAFFFGTILSMVFVSWKSLGGIKDNFHFGLVSGFIALTLGLLVNAMTIDIFEASKVAYVFWGVAGLTMGSIFISKEQISKNREPLRIPFSFASLFIKVKKFLVSDLFFITILAIFALNLRMYKLNEPLADWHSWRQADTSAVTRNYIKIDGAINMLYPIYDDISSIASGKFNPTGYRFVEFPLYNAASVFVNKIFANDISIEGSGRLTTALAGIMSLVFIFLICRKIFTRRIAYFSALAFAIIPYNIFYGRVILPDPTMVSLSLGGIWFALRYLEFGKKRELVLTLVFAMAAILVKPYAVFLLSPIGYLMLINLKARKRILGIAVVGLLSIIPFLLWRNWISHFPEGIPASDWLFNGDGIRFKGAFWYWLFADRIGRLILGYWGLILLGAGLIRPLIGKYKYFPLTLFFSSLLYLVIFATGNVRHDYYQILIVPSLAILIGLGMDSLFSFNWRAKVLSVLCLLFMVGFGWYFIRDFYNINHPEIVAAGQYFEKMTKDSHPNSLVVAPYNGDTAFLYQTGHKGWPIMEGSIDDMIKKGAQYYISVNYDETTNNLIKDSWPVWEVNTKNVIKKYKLLESTGSYVIIQLVPDRELLK